MLGLTVIPWIGIITYSLVVFTATMVILKTRGIHKIPFKWHKKMAFTAISFATFHAFLVVGTKLF